MGIEAHVVLGYSCNSQCKHCVVQVRRGKYEKTNNEQLNFTKIEAFEHINSIVEKEVDEIVISGGEPTLRADIVELVRHTLNNNIITQVQTNGIRTDVIKEIVKIAKGKKSLLKFMIPIHSSLDSEHDFITGNNNGFINTVKSLELLYSENIEIIGKVVLTKYTGDLSNIVDLYTRYGVKNIIITYPHCVSFTDELIKSVDLKLSEVEKRIKFVSKLDSNINIIFQGIPFCYVDNMYGKIQENDQAYLDRKIVEYKYRDDFEYLWHEFRKKDKLKFKKCKNCKMSDRCEGIWKEYIRIYGEE